MGLIYRFRNFKIKWILWGHTGYVKLWEEQENKRNET